MLKKNIWQSIMLLCMIREAFGQFPYLGPCPKITTKPNFELRKYAGVWYEESRTFSPVEGGHKCQTGRYYLNDKGGFRFNYSQVLYLTNSMLFTQAEFSVPNEKEPGQLEVMTTSLPIEITFPYSVLDTDYDSYSVISICGDYKIFSLQFFFILTREWNPPQSVIKRAVAAAAAQHLDVSKLMKADQNNCPSDF